MHLSDVFKFTQGLGQKGHQIGRKVGDAIELVTLAMIYREEELSKFLEIEDGIEGATSAKHKVEFAFYKLEDDKPSKESEDLFGIIECKKVGVEQTVKQNFKKWQKLDKNKKDFHLTTGYSFSISPSNTDFRWLISIKSIDQNGDNIKVTSCKNENNENSEEIARSYNCQAGNQILIGHNVENELFILGPDQVLSEVQHSVKKCNVIQIQSLEGDQVRTIHVNESLAGPQTPEKAKQASFVSLDVRKKVLGRFDKSEIKDFISILVIGEFSHWEEKSRSMIRLCNDHNLVIPDGVLVRLFEDFEQKFGEPYQEMITKTSYKLSQDVRDVVDNVIQHFQGSILFEMDTGVFVEFEYYKEGGKDKLRLKPINQN